MKLRNTKPPCLVGTAAYFFTRPLSPGLGCKSKIERVVGPVASHGRRPGVVIFNFREILTFGQNRWFALGRRLRGDEEHSELMQKIFEHLGFIRLKISLRLFLEHL